MNYSEIFQNYKVIAVLGFSNNPVRASNRIGRYLLQNGFTVYGVNPALENKIVDGIKCFDRLESVPEKIQIVNIFRRSEFLPDIISEILALDFKPAVIWTQIGVIDKNSGEVASKNQIEYIENKCIMVEHQKLLH